jgi:16S rRNA (cytosine967-C5)-methyltransferase
MKMSKQKDTRTHAAAWVLAAASRAVAAVVHEGRSADAALAACGADEQRRAINAVTLGTLRWYLRYQPAIRSLLARDPSTAPPLLLGLLAVAVHQLEMSRIPRESTVSAAVDAARTLGLKHVAGMVNAVLRRWLREREALQPLLDADLATVSAHPSWFVRLIEAQWPAEAASILEANNGHPPLTLRVNPQRTTTAAALAALQAADLGAERIAWLPGGITLATPVSVRRLPGFAAGELSVQDASAQLAALLLQPRDGERVLDACAAPGGKTAQLAELADVELDAVEIDAQRATRIASNLARTSAHQHARIRVIVGDASKPQSFAPATGYQRILLDAPCTASGIVRRHPDIPWLRRPADVAQLATLQARLADALWPLLAPAGRLLYVVCSMFPEEGEYQAERFATRWPDARPVRLPASSTKASVQLLPVEVAQTYGGGLPTVHDGFFFALFEKS